MEAINIGLQHYIVEKDLLTELISLFCFIKSMVEIEGDLVSHSDDTETGVFLLVQKYGT